MGHSSLITARNAKDDEFYTRPEDVESELAHYAPHFSGKVVYCNCDAPGQSAFWQYFDANFSKLGLSGLIATHYDPYGPCLAMYGTGLVFIGPGWPETAIFGQRLVWTCFSSLIL